MVPMSIKVKIMNCPIIVILKQIKLIFHNTDAPLLTTFDSQTFGDTDRAVHRSKVFVQKCCKLDFVLSTYSIKCIFPLLISMLGAVIMCLATAAQDHAPLPSLLYMRYVYKIVTKAANTMLHKNLKMNKKLCFTVSKWFPDWHCAKSVVDTVWFLFCHTFIVPKYLDLVSRSVTNFVFH